MILTNREILEKMKEIEHRIDIHDDNFLLIFEYIRQLELSRQQLDEQANRKRVGFRIVKLSNKSNGQSRRHLAEKPPALSSLSRSQLLLLKTRKEPLKLLVWVLLQ